MRAALVRSNWFKADVCGAFVWYQEQASRDVVLRLAEALRDVLKLVQAHPEISPVRNIAGVPIRSFPMREFPYVLYWNYDGETIVLASFLHASRDRAAILTGRYPWRV